MQAKINSEITIGALEYEDKNIAERIFDLKGHTGERIRVHIDNDNKLTIETRPTQKLLICELDIPEKVLVHTKTTKKDENGEFIVKTTEKVMDLSKVEMKEYLDLEEEVKKITK
jgi:hypothetical protein